jgi:hypothetical protein
MKGIELPINVLIIVAVAIIVLIAVVAMFFPAWRNASGTVTSDVAKSAACQLLIERGCNVETKYITIKNFDADKDGTYGTIDATSNWGWNPISLCMNTLHTGASGDNLASLCACYYSIGSGTDPESVCKELCGCSA